MASFAPQFDATYVLTGPDGARAVFNDQTDPDYVGVLTDISGFDSPDVRESADDLIQQDGGIHGSFYYGRRPLTMSGIMLNPASTDARNQRWTKLSRASNAMREDAVLTWTLAGGEQQFLAVRRQQPLRATGGWQKEFQLSLVAADPRIYSQAQHTNNVNLSGAGGSGGFAFNMGFDLGFGLAVVSGQMLLTNAGNFPTYPVFVITGPVVNPTIQNFTTGATLYLTYSLAAGEQLVVDTLNHTVLLGGTASRYSAVDFPRSSADWLPFVPGVNDVRLAVDSFSAGANLAATWRDAWL